MRPARNRAATRALDYKHRARRISVHRLLRMHVAPTLISPAMTSVVPGLRMAAVRAEPWRSGTTLGLALSTSRGAFSFAQVGAVSVLT